MIEDRKVPYRDEEAGFSLVLPAGWIVEEDGEGGILLFRENGSGLLHMIPFERAPEEEADPAEELYAFLAEQEIELEEDEVEDLELPGIGSASVCTYIEEDDEESVFWLIGVATAPGRLVFSSYSCTAGEEGEEVDAVLEILGTLTFSDP